MEQKQQEDETLTLLREHFRQSMRIKELEEEVKILRTKTPAKDDSSSDSSSDESEDDNEAEQAEDEAEQTEDEAEQAEDEAEQAEQAINLNPTPYRIYINGTGYCDVLRGARGGLFADRNGHYSRLTTPQKNKIQRKNEE